MFDIIADSACDFTPEMAQKMGVEIVPFYVSLDGEHYRKEGKEIAVRDFYQFMVDNPSAYPKTSLASIEDFEEVFRRQAEAGRPTLCLCFTSKMSGCVGSARNARELGWSGRPRPTRRPSNGPRSCNRSSCSQSRGYPNRYPSSRQSYVAPYIHGCILANPHARTEAGRVATSHTRKRRTGQDTRAASKPMARRFACR